MYNSSKEIITLQFGDYANYVATNFWNIEQANASFSNQSGSNDASSSDPYLNNSDNNFSSSHTNPYYKNAHKKYHQRKSSNSRRKHGSQSSNDTSLSYEKQLSNYLSTSHSANLDPNVCFFNKNHFLNPNATLNSNNNTENNENGNIMNNNSNEYMPRTIIFAASGSEGNILKEIEYYNNRSYKSSKYYSFTQKPTNNDFDNIFTWNNQISTFHTPSFKLSGLYLSL